MLDSPSPQPLSRSSLVFLLVLDPLLHTPCISSPNHHHLFAAHAHTITACSAVIPMLCHLFPISLSAPYLSLAQKGLQPELTQEATVLSQYHYLNPISTEFQYPLWLVSFLLPALTILQSAQTTAGYCQNTVLLSAWPCARITDVQPPLCINCTTQSTAISLQMTLQWSIVSSHLCSNNCRILSEHGFAVCLTLLTATSTFELGRISYSTTAMLLLLLLLPFYYHHTRCVSWYPQQITTGFCYGKALLSACNC